LLFFSRQVVLGAVHVCDSVRHIGVFCDSRLEGSQGLTRGMNKYHQVQMARKVG